ncbi:ParB/RepB/Spo0J family partition protein [Paenibacillus sp. SYP-B4298]|uniref:ParB/RepB/Spo0J family partition protein n=1 Tax=Paenibacillus sp. SYP-B4298 TaxID=2996034 RepID=UPI0022DE1D33|nr:ParB/RepB/Spo0J family partition protein [Paenibacillus sp. SYP-B4298]
MNVVNIELALIDEDKDQPRYQFQPEAMEELMRSISELGLLSPIKVRPTADGRYKIIYGNRRYKASQLLGKATIPCIISDAVDEMDIYLEQVAENLTREGFSPIEEAEAFHKLMHDGRFRSSLKLVSSKLGKPESYIKNKCELLKFGRSVKKLIVSGTEIRRNMLTEEQLLPLKDLPMEHRDPLALITARDALPVSDVKKIAKLFKDSSISDSTKEKLLLKNGDGLIETWSVYEQNRKERARVQREQAEEAARRAAQADAAQAAKAAAAAEAAEAAKAAARLAGGGDATAAQGAGAGAGAAAARAAGAGAAAEAGGAAAQAATPGAQPAAADSASSLAGDAASSGQRPAAASAAAAAGAGAAAQAQPAAGSLDELLSELLALLPRQQELTQQIQALAAMPAARSAALTVREADAVIMALQEQVQQWHAVREQLPLWR